MIAFLCLNFFTLLHCKYFSIMVISNQLHKYQLFCLFFFSGNEVYTWFWVKNSHGWFHLINTTTILCNTGMKCLFTWRSCCIVLSHNMSVLRNKEVTSHRGITHSSLTALPAFTLLSLPYNLFVIFLHVSLCWKIN